MSASPAIRIRPTHTSNQSAQNSGSNGVVDTMKKNDPELYRWALGWFLEQLRDKTSHSQTSFGKLIGLSQTGYFKVEKGESPNFDHILNALDLHGKDIVPVMSLCRVIVRAIQAEEMFREDPLSREGRERVAAEILQTMDTGLDTDLDSP